MPGYRNLSTIFSRFIGFLILVIAEGCTSSEPPANSDKIEIGRKRRIYSTVLDEDREYWIYLPEDYDDTTYAPYSYPVLYLLDGDRHFHSLTGIQEFLSRGPYASLPEMIIVGVLNTDRTRDLTPTRHHDSELFPGNGGGERFMEFIEKELMPATAADYRTNGYRILVGHSFGGLTALHTLLTQPDLFNAYVAIDPSVWWNDRYLLKKARRTLDSLDLTGKVLYLAQADKRMLPQDTSTEHERMIRAFKATLDQAHNGLRWDYCFFENEDHGTVPLPAEYSGLRFIYQGFQSEVKKVADDPHLLMENYKNLSEKLGFEIQPAESLVDWIAEYCLRTDREPQAVALFRLNAALYPHSPHAVRMRNRHP